MMALKFFSLRTVSIFYLTLPLLIFILSWTNLIFSLSIGLFYALAIFFSCKKEHIGFPKIEYTDSLWIIFVLMWLALSGIGGIGLQNGDYLKHNSILYDLIENSWPVTYVKQGDPNEKLILRYYLAYYLPSSLIGKIFGYFWAEKFQFVWSYFGLIILFFWVKKIVKSSIQTFLFAVFFVLVGGLDIIGTVVFNQPFNYSSHIEWWSGFWQYSSNTTLLFWVPQHAIAAWIAAVYFVYLVQNNLIDKTMVLFFTPLLFWSPFAFIGMMPLMLIFLNWENFKKNFGWENIVSIFVICSIAFYLVVDGQERGHFIFEGHSFFDLTKKYLLFIFLELALFIILFFKMKSLKPLLIFSLIVLFLIPIYKLGLYNDFAMRASIFPLFVVQVIVFLNFINLEKKWKTFLIVLWLFSSGASIFEWNRSFRNYNFKYNYTTTPFMPVVFAKQYLTNANNWFLNFYLKKKEFPKDKVTMIPDQLYEQIIQR